MFHPRVPQAHCTASLHHAHELLILSWDDIRDRPPITTSWCYCTSMFVDWFTRGSVPTREKKTTFQVMIATPPLLTGSCTDLASALMVKVPHCQTPLINRQREHQPITVLRTLARQPGKVPLNDSTTSSPG